MTHSAIGNFDPFDPSRKSCHRKQAFVWTLLFCFESVFHESSNITIYLGAIFAL